MISIHFEEKDECRQVFEQLKLHTEKYKSLGLHSTVECLHDQIITITDDKHDDHFYETVQPLIVSILTNHIIAEKEEEWLLNIIESMFYFKDPEEKNQIVTIARSIIEGDREDLPRSIKKFYARESLIYEAFASCLRKDSTLYYDPFLTFRLKAYGEMLIDCVEIAIDEYMLEQEYQNMVESFRFFIKVKPAKVDVIHLVHKESFSFYDQQFRKLTPSEISEYLDEELRFEDGVPIEEMVISPLVSMSPKKIFLYSNTVDDGVIQTIQTVFQERVSLHHLREFTYGEHQDTLLQ
ncbi:putative sporulation protein YtxC [Desertibacillus haloalkaliphilus]|uniref:putative sporulation protein YtxC n=1 Tax=Desertibacillus haloalkaliphilus TaxID=1328930 RepID=UPI001C274A35|nr:putative sporulation protein YtxC [Desertibacillus haloalkaliphilus]MBU8905137.1 putative sporulation protein YtxC [Desertibacillus haloalkaliphilus]